MGFTYDHKAEGMASDSPEFFHRVTYAVGGDTYTTGGLVLDWTDAGLDGKLNGKTILAVICLGGGGYDAEYDYSGNFKLKVFYSDLSESSDGPKIEFPASALTATFTLLVIAV